MKIEKKDLGQSQVELTIEVPLEEIDEHLKKAAVRISNKTTIAGFRPGKAPYEKVKNQVGEMNIYQEALEEIINHSFFQAVKQENLITVGQPDIKIEKFAPQNPIIYTATVALLPKVTLGNWSEKKIVSEEIKIAEEEITKTLAELQKMRAQETLVDRAAKLGDKVEIDFEVSLNKAVLEGGTSHKHPVILGEGKMVPGFEEKIIASTAGQDLEFDLKMPEKYFQENLAGKELHFKIKILGVYERIVPELTDDLAKNFGFENKEALKKQISDNILQDKKNKQNQKNEREAIKILIDTATIDEIPEKLIHDEIHKMIHELRYDIEKQGLELPKYLESIKKTEADLHKDFRESAIERIKASLILKTLADDEKISVSEEDLNKEIEEVKKQQAMYQENTLDVNNPSYQQYLKNILLNKKTLEFILAKILK